MTRRKPAPKVPADDAGRPARDAAARAFVRGLVARGEAARPNPDGSLPPGATHEIVGEEPDGTPIVRRRRFSAY
jgi:hypothetical protein